MLLAAAVLFSATAMQAQNNSEHDFNVAKNLEIFSDIYKNLDMIYVDTLDANQVIGTGISAMMNSLDPYTEYYPEDETQELKQALTGKYAGIGALIRYNLSIDNTVIDEPYEGMPAAEAGLKKGDIILSIDDTSMVKKNTAYVSSHLRGDAGTTFVLKIKRPSTGKIMSMKVTRCAIQLPYLPYYGIIDNGMGYINLNSFTENCARDMPCLHRA